MDSVSLKPIFECVDGMCLDQLLKCQPILHLLLAVVAGAPNTPETRSILYDELTFLHLSETWPTRADDGVPDWPFLKSMDSYRRAFNSNSERLFPLIGTHPPKFFVDVCAYLCTYGRYSAPLS
jgi:hypothetical protein